MRTTIAIMSLWMGLIGAPAFAETPKRTISPEEARIQRLERFNQIERSLAKLRSDLQRTQVRLRELQGDVIAWARPTRTIHIGGKRKPHERNGKR
ncbi:MAG: hypothetical protein KC609_20420 [Myxococcales bacterium]|nr:hypothetical protein [Myxococcales bacterium]